jgi:hypothetical protein
MLDLISVESSSEEVQEKFYQELIEQLGTYGKSKLEHSEGGLSICSWSRQAVLVVSGEQSVRFPMKALLQLVEEYAATNWQIWTRLKLNESTLRQFRKMETEGKLKFSCYLLAHTYPNADYKQLERIVKISQNKPLGAVWISYSTEKTTSLIISKRMSHQYGLVYPIKTLEKVSSADTDPVETPLSTMMRRYYSEARQRQIHWYPKKYVHKKMDEEKWGVDPLSKSKQGSVKRHVLVTGTGRSGTTYFSDLLTMLGLDVGHQRNGKDGCSGAEFAVDHDWYPWFPVYGGGDCANVGERRSDYTYAHVLHIVRHPLWCIPSLMRNYPAINPEFWADNGAMDPKAMDGSSIYRNASMYYGINKRIDESKQAEYRCQLEQIHDHWGDLMDVLELPGTPDPQLGATNQASGWGQYEPLTWAELELQVGKSLADGIRSQAKRYGYE